LLYDCRDAWGRRAPLRVKIDSLQRGVELVAASPQETAGGVAQGSGEGPLLLE
jgi:hypothetical protein